MLRSISNSKTLHLIYVVKNSSLNRYAIQKSLKYYSMCALFEITKNHKIQPFF